MSDPKKTALAIAIQANVPVLLWGAPGTGRRTEPGTKAGIPKGILKGIPKGIPRPARRAIPLRRECLLGGVAAR